MAKVKVIYWKKEIAKYIGPLNKKIDDLFREYDKRQKSVNAKTTPQQNELWKREFQKKYDRLDKKIDAAYLRLYLKYHVSAGSTKVKPGYKIVR